VSGGLALLRAFCQRRIEHLLFISDISFPFFLCNHRRSQRAPRWPLPQISSKSCHFVLWQAVSRTKYFCTLKVKVLAPQKILGRLRYCL